LAFRPVSRRQPTAPPEPRPRLLTDGAHLSSPTPRRLLPGLRRRRPRVRPRHALTCGPLAKAVRQALISRAAPLGSLTRATRSTRAAAFCYRAPPETLAAATSIPLLRRRFAVVKQPRSRARRRASHPCRLLMSPRI
jgi:hypothetical protein